MHLLPSFEDSVDLRLKELLVQSPGLQASVNGGGFLQLHNLLTQLKQVHVRVCHHLGKSAPLLDPLDAGSLDQLLDGTQPLLVRVAEGQETSQKVQTGAVVLGTNRLSLRRCIFHGRPVLHAPGILQNKERTCSVLRLSEVVERLPLTQFFGALTPVLLPHLVFRQDGRRCRCRAVKFPRPLYGVFVRLLRGLEQTLALIDEGNGGVREVASLYPQTRAQVLLVKSAVDVAQGVQSLL